MENSAALELLDVVGWTSSVSCGAGDGALGVAGALGDLRGMAFKSGVTNITRPKGNSYLS